MGRGKRRARAVAAGDLSGAVEAPRPSPDLVARLEQAKLLRSPRTQAIWQRLNERQRRYVLDPLAHPRVERRYPLTSGDVTAIT
jgi:hypothetical protein